MFKQPRRLWEQYAGKAQAEMLRGSGWWPAQDEPCALEPPWEPYDRKTVNQWDCVVNNWEASYYGGTLVWNGVTITLPQADVLSNWVTITFEQFHEDDNTVPIAEQLLGSLRAARYPVAFELLGVGATPKLDFDKYSQNILAQAASDRDLSRDDAITGWNEPYTLTQFAVQAHDASLVQQQLAINYPNSAVVHQPCPDWPIAALRNEPASCGCTMALESGYGFPLRTFTRYDPDPLGVAIAAMDGLGPEEWALLQVVFQPARQSWPDVLYDALENPYRPGEFVVGDDNDTKRLLKEKFSTPLFAVSVRLMASRHDVFQHLLGWAEQFSRAPHQRMVVNDCDWDDGAPHDWERNWLDQSAMFRGTHRAGMLLSAAELAGMVHLASASVPSERLKRVTARTRPAPQAQDDAGSVIVGVNVHRGKKTTARIPFGLRQRHCYIAGASGTGKSTLLLNTIMQDVHAGRGVGVLDPHGDLVNAVLSRIPPERVRDVILFDPSDQEFPFALNILEAKDENERERIVNETVMSLERYFPASWGPRLERIVTFAIHTVLHAVPGATLADVERLLIDREYRESVVRRTTEGRLSHFWAEEFSHFPKNAVDPVLNKLSVFLMSRPVRNIICQRRSALDFDRLLNHRKILLANLSTGLLSEKIAGTFGSFLVTKIVNAAFRRARVPREQREPWFLYVDEFQSFMNLSVGFERILAEARKYNLVLAGLANQYVGQLSPAVRHAIFGNVGTMIVFRLGTDDANIAAKEMGVFEADEIMNLELGQAILRVGGSKTAHNVSTYPDPELPVHDPSPVIVERMRRKYSRPRAKVERELAAGREFPRAGKEPDPKQGNKSKPKRKRDGGSDDPPPSDPSEDDLVN